MLQLSASAQALTDPTVAVLLLDVVIGYGAHTDPAAVVADALRRCERRNVQVLASVTGTEQDRLVALFLKIRRGPDGAGGAVGA